MNLYFAFSATILLSMSMSAMFKKIIYFEDLKLSVFSGVITVGVIANFIIDPYIAIQAGLITSLLTTILCMFIRPSL